MSISGDSAGRRVISRSSEQFAAAMVLAVSLGTAMPAGVSAQDMPQTSQATSPRNSAPVAPAPLVSAPVAQSMPAIQPDTGNVASKEASQPLPPVLAAPATSPSDPAAPAGAPVIPPALDPPASTPSGHTPTLASSTTGAALGALPASDHDLSPMGMFYAADPVVKGVMVLLAAASVMTWTIFLMKIFVLFFAKRRMRKAIRSISVSASLAEAVIGVRAGAAARLLHEAADEAAQSFGLPSEGTKERVHIALGRIETAIGRRMAIGTGMLATIGSVGPFVGLFGTVWGIMRSFIGIANSNTTNLAVVAPGIAEALLATGIGLVAAIPAVIIYNALTRSIGSYRVMSGDVVALIMRHLSRDLDRQEHGMPALTSSALRVAAE